MKKLVIFSLAVLLVVFMAAGAMADITDGGNTGSNIAQAGDTAVNVPNANIQVPIDSNNTKTITKTDTTTIDKSGQTNTDQKSKASDNIAGAQNAGSGSATDTTTVTTGDIASGNPTTTGSDNTKTITKTDTDTKTIQKVDDTKNGSAAAVNGNASVTKDSGNTKTITKDSGNTKTVTVDKSGQTNLEKASVDNEAGAQNVGNGNSATSTYSKTTTIDKSGQNNAKVIAKDGSAASQTGNAVANAYNTKGSYNTKDSNNTTGSFNTIYAVDDQVLVNNNSGASAGIAATLTGQNLTVTKNWTAQNNGSFNNINGIVNNNNVAGNFNNSTASTSFSLNGGVNVH